jgi:hypothetical protein
MWRIENYSPKWKTIRRAIRHLVRRQEQSAALAQSTE